jgi:hypothetical protein
VGSTIHCCAGDATGIILAAAITALLGLPMWIDLIVEYTAGFLFGLLIFQSLFMRRMMGGTYLDNVRRMFVPELISMNMMMAGMAPVMSLLMMGRDMRAMQPTELLFWGVMSLGVIVGFAFAYPANVWLVLRNLKHGLMTERPGVEGFRTSASDESCGAFEPRSQPFDGGSNNPTATGHGDRHHGAFLADRARGPCIFCESAARCARRRWRDHAAGNDHGPRYAGRSMRDMSAVLPRYVSYVATPDARGDAP